MSEEWKQHVTGLYGPDIVADMKSTSPSVTARIVNRSVTQEDHPLIQFYAPNCYLERINKNHNNHDYFLDPASVFPVAALDPQPGERILDLCAAPGGKSLLIAGSILSKKSILTRLVAVDSSPSRCDRLRQTLKSHFPGSDTPITVINCNPLTNKRALANHGVFSKILVDAPCSSDRHQLQTVGELDHWKPRSSKVKAETQLKLLMAAEQLLKNPGGRLVYSTCSLIDHENDGVVKKAIQQTKGRLKLVKKRIVLENGLVTNGDAELGVGSARNGGVQLKNGVMELQETECGYIALPGKCCGCGPIYFAVMEKEF